jgi:hypothetical protein
VVAGLTGALLHEVENHFQYQFYSTPVSPAATGLVVTE